MIKLNLLPLEQKKRLRLHFIGYNVVFSGCFIIFLLLIFVLFLAGFLMFSNIESGLINQEIVGEQSRILQNNTIKGIEKKVKELNDELLNLDKITKNQSSFYQTLSNIIPELLSRVSVYTLEIDRATKVVTVAGFSSTRENLLEIKQKLENSPRYKKVDFPMSNLTNAKNIDFRFSFIYE
jgi:Tfp pilus assembly protein PilN